jgi:hypothetical protein
MYRNLPISLDFFGNFFKPQVLKKKVMEFCDKLVFGTVLNFHTKRKGCQQQAQRPELGFVAETN